jgi:hypothetical protein
MNPLIAKIKALRELARNNSNPHEAENAASAAEKLCQEHRISEAMLDGDVGASGPVSADVDAFTQIEPWKSYLLTDLAKLHGCEVVYLRTRGRGYEAVAYGTDGDLATLKAMYDWLVSEMLSQAEAGPSSPRWRKSFLLGASEGIREALKEGAKQARKEAPSTALTILDARLEAAHKAVKEKHGKLEKAAHERPRGDSKALDAGYEIGREIAGRYGRDKRGALR